MSIPIDQVPLPTSSNQVEVKKTRNIQQMIEQLRISQLARIAKAKHAMKHVKEPQLSALIKELLPMQLLADLLCAENAEKICGFKFMFYVFPKHVSSRELVERPEWHSSNLGLDLDEGYEIFVNDNDWNIIDRLRKFITLKDPQTVPTCSAPDGFGILYQAMAHDAFPTPIFKLDGHNCPKDIPIRLEDGTPNPKFFEQWYENCLKKLKPTIE